MILWFTIVQMAVAIAAGLLCVVFGLIGRKPADITLGSLVLVELLLIAQLVLAIVQPFVGNPPTGSPLEYWLYLVGAIIIPPLGGHLGARSSATAGAPSCSASRRSRSPSCSAGCSRSGPSSSPEPRAS